MFDIVCINQYSTCKTILTNPWISEIVCVHRLTCTIDLPYYQVGICPWLLTEVHIIFTQAAHSVSQRDNHVCSLRVCEVLLLLLDFLLDLGILKTTKRWEKLEQDDQSEDDAKPPVKDKEHKLHNMVMDAVIRYCMP